MTQSRYILFFDTSKLHREFMHHPHTHRDRASRRFARGGRSGDHPDHDLYQESGWRRSRHGGHGRRSGRIFDHGELRLVVLGLISERPRHGYEIIKAIEDRVAGTYSPSPGVIYPTLTLLGE